MHPLVVGLAVVVALGAAAYSTWSPCGQSMLSQLNPVAERSRRQRYGVTATWFVVGAVAGGATLGAGVALLAAGVRALGIDATTAAGIGAAAALLGAATDGRLLPWAPPFHRRQVNEDWLPRYRGWVYGVGFGWQIGTGVATYIMTSAVLVMIALGALGASPIAAVAVCLLFALARGLVVLATARLTTFDRLAAFHRRFHALGPVVQRAVIGVQLAVGLVAAVAAAGWIGALGVLVLAGVGLALRARVTRSARSLTPRVS